MTTPEDTAAMATEIATTITAAADAMVAVPGPAARDQALSFDPAVREANRAYETAKTFRAGIARAALLSVSRYMSCGADHEAERDGIEQAIRLLPDDDALTSFAMMQDNPPAPGQPFAQPTGWGESHYFPVGQRA